jgi:hypothetical protein
MDEYQTAGILCLDVSFGPAPNRRRFLAFLPDLCLRPGHLHLLLQTGKQIQAIRQKEKKVDSVHPEMAIFADFRVGQKF